MQYCATKFRYAGCTCITYVHVHDRDQVLCVGAQKSSQLVHEIAMADRYEYAKSQALFNVM